MARRPRTNRIALPPSFTRRQFRQNANPLKFSIGSTQIGVLTPGEHSTGSLGWKFNGKLQIKNGDVMVWCQVGVNVTVIGSKDLPNDSDLQGATP